MGFAATGPCEAACGAAADDDTGDSDSASAVFASVGTTAASSTCRLDVGFATEGPMSPESNTRIALRGGSRALCADSFDAPRREAMCSSGEADECESTEVSAEAGDDARTSANTAETTADDSARS